MTSRSSLPILICGASGLLGKALSARLGRLYEIRGVSRRGGEGIVSADLSVSGEVTRLFKDQRFSAVIHAAALSDVDGCENNPDAAYAANALSSRHLATACEASRTPYLYISTDYVFDGRKGAPYEPEDPVSPANIYGMTKLAGEIFARRAGLAFVVRTSWLFGPGAGTDFVSTVWKRLLHEPVVRVLDDQVNSPTYVEDLSEALEFLVARAMELGARDASAFEVFHVSNSGTATRYAMAVKMKEILGVAASVEKADPASVAGRVAIRPPFSALSGGRFESVFGRRMRHWEDSLTDYLFHSSACAS